MSAGKGDKPRNCFSKQYKSNYELINWKNSKKKKKGSNSER
jgi:hypothetical protein